MVLTDAQRLVMGASGNVLVTGGPGAGKTTISVVKAASIAERQLGPEQAVLFLGFARATVSRIEDAIRQYHHINPELNRQIHVETYHAFFWRILRTHGYLVGLPRRLSILLPQDEAVALSEIRSRYGSKLDDEAKGELRRQESKERHRLAIYEGRVCFDLFAHLVGCILHDSERIRQLVSLMYPYVILDEFQDTNVDQWKVIQAIGESSTMVALADPEQRIFDWIGADPERLSHFTSTFRPVVIDLGSYNHRSEGTDIRTFGDHVLTGRFREVSYRGVEVVHYGSSANQAMAMLVGRVLRSKRRLEQTGRRDWSLAVLVATKRMTRFASDALRSPPAQMPAVPHLAVVDVEGPILASKLVAFLMQPDVEDVHFPRFVDLLCDFFNGRGGERPTKGNLRKAEAIRQAFDEYILRSEERKKMRGTSILAKTLYVYRNARSLQFTGDPEVDWRAIHGVLRQGACSRLEAVAEEVRNVRLMDRGAELRQALAQDWRDNGAYPSATEIIARTFEEQHFAMSRRPETGVVVMNMHKSKGKQFDEVIIFDGWPIRVQGVIKTNRDRIVRSNSRDFDCESVRQNLRVSVTRAKVSTTILTPSQDPCILLPRR